MAPKEFHYRWEYELSASPSALWPAVADTNRFNRDAGVPALSSVAFAETAGGETKKPKARRLRLSKLGLKVEWEEEPFEWVRPHRFGVVRRYRGGPVAEMRVEARLTEREDGGTYLVYEVWAKPRGALGRAAIPLQIGRISARRFADTFRRYDEQAGRDGQAAAPLPAARLDVSERALLASLKAKLLETDVDAGLVERLAETIERGDELTLTRLRPYALADCWRASRRDVLELCLLATRAGLLDLRWELLCPLCRGASRSVPTLAEIRSGQHCESCNIDYLVNFDRSVEVVFRPNASLRRVAEREFCVGGPRVTPHIVAQQLVAPGERRTFSTQLEEGRYRVRTHGSQGGRLVFVAPGGEDAALFFRADGESWPRGELRLSTTPELTFENATTEGQLFVLERTTWSDQAATAAEVTALQLFRDLFASEALRPGDRISVGRMTILFTDLRDSTRLYREIGDAVAFGAVMNHFDVLREEIAGEGGSIVKTLGDAVMAVFPRPAPALRAVTAAQRRLASPPEGVRPLRLKAGIHNGPCIAVTLNGRLDYFGSNVNIAARLEPLSTGRDCVISADVRRDPEVEELLSGPARAFKTEPLEARLKGFDEESFELWRVMSKREDSD